MTLLQRFRLLNWIRRQGGRTTVRNVMRSWRCFATAVAARRDLQVLVRLGYGKWHYPKPLGRPTEILILTEREPRRQRRSPVQRLITEAYVASEVSQPGAPIVQWALSDAINDVIASSPEISASAVAEALATLAAKITELGGRPDTKPAAGPAPRGSVSRS